MSHVAVRLSLFLRQHWKATEREGKLRLHRNAIYEKGWYHQDVTDVWLFMQSKNKKKHWGSKVLIGSFNENEVFEKKNLVVPFKKKSQLPIFKHSFLMWSFFIFDIISCNREDWYLWIFMKPVGVSNEFWNNCFYYINFSLWICLNIMFLIEKIIKI